MELGLFEKSTFFPPDPLAAGTQSSFSSLSSSSTPRLSSSSASSAPFSSPAAHYATCRPPVYNAPVNGWLLCRRPPLPPMKPQQKQPSDVVLAIVVHLCHLGGTFLFSLVFWGAGIQGRIPVPAGFRQNPAATSLMFRLFYGPEPYFRSGPESVLV